VDDQTLSNLRARVAKLEARHCQGTARAAQRWPETRRERFAQRLLPLTLAALLVALVPLATLAAGPFGDLNSGSPHNENIQAIAEAGITKGCDPPEFVAYCPNGLVTREEMASFLARTAGLGTNPPVVNAATAANATQLGGQPPAYYQPADQPIMNANNAVYAVTAGTANTVLGYGPNALVRVARSLAGTGVIASLNYETFATITITAPGTGFVLLTGTGDVTNQAATGCPCQLQYRLTDTSLLDTQSFQLVTVGNSAGGVESSSTLATTRVFAVEPGVNEFVLQARRATGAAPLNIFAELAALYVPFGATGASTVEVDEPPTGGGSTR
jgi:hypothetical protein